METSVDFTNATTSEPTFSSSSSTERVVITEVTMPNGVSTSTSDTTEPRMISLILPSELITYVDCGNAHIE